MKFLSILMSICFTLVLTGCNTVEGLGKDVEATGEAIEDSASDNKNY